MTSTRTPQRRRTASTNAARFAALRSAAVPTAAMSSPPGPSRVAGHVADRLDRPRHRHPAEVAALVQALAEPRDHGAVEDGAPRAVGGAFADVELYGVGADVDRCAAVRRSR
jgi:hypothetical protein